MSAPTRSSSPLDAAGKVTFSNALTTRAVTIGTSSQLLHDAEQLGAKPFALP